MILGQVKNINEYNSLIISLNPLGKYQFVIYALNFLCWMLAGSLKTTFDLNFSHIQCPYSRSLFQCIGILLAGWVAAKKDRKVALISMGICSLLGFTCCLVSIAKGQRNLGIVGTSLMAMATYSQPFLSLCIICELAKHSIIKYLLCISLSVFCISRASTIGLVYLLEIPLNKFDKWREELYLFSLLLAPIVLGQLLIGWVIDESPRTIIDHDFDKAETLIRKITRINAIPEERVHIDDYFVLKRINIQRHNYFHLSRFKSFGLAQYSLVLVMLLLGIISECPHYVLTEGTFFTSNTIQVAWVTGFELVGIAGIAFFIGFSRRKLACLINSFIVASLNTVLYFVFADKISDDLVILGLNAVFSISLYVFLLYNAIEMYPHSVRTIGLGLTLSAYYAGSFLTLMFKFLKPKGSDVLELFMLGAWLMFMHSWGLRETMGKGLAYEVKQIEEEDEQQDI